MNRDRTGLIMALSGIFEPGYKASELSEYEEELDYLNQACGSSGNE